MAEVQSETDKSRLLNWTHLLDRSRAHHDGGMVYFHFGGHGQKSIMGSKKNT
jgi:hypothetical protein